MGTCRDSASVSGILIGHGGQHVKDEAGILKTMPRSNNIHVVPHGDQWAWRREGSSRVSGVARTQSAAVDQARAASRAGKGELFIHSPNGQIRDRDSHGNEPRRSKG